MRLGIDIRTLLDRPLSGIGQYTERLLSHILRIAPEDDTFTLFLNSFRTPPSVDTSSRPATRLRYLRFPNKVLNAWLWAAQYPTIDRLMGGVDAVFAPNLNFIPTAPKVPLVITAHDLSYIHYAPLYSARMRLWHKAVNPKRLFHAARAVIAVSQSTADDLIRSVGLPASKIHVVYSGIEVSKVSEAEQHEARERYALPEHFVFSLATLEPRKNLMSVLAAFELLRRKGYAGHLVFAGRMGWLSSGFRRALAAHPFRESIHMLGYIPGEDRARLLAAADAAVYPSVFEGFGFPPLEAMALGTPVVAGAHSSVSELAGEAAMLVDIHNVRDIAEALWRVVHEDIRVDAGYSNTLRQRFTWERAARETLEVIYHAT